MFSYKICLLRAKNLEAVKNLKIYDPDPEWNFSKAKLARRPRNEEQREIGETASDAANHSGTFPPLTQHLVMVLPSFPRSFRLIH